jgi:hypothetical protein
MSLQLMDGVGSAKKKGEEEEQETLREKKYLKGKGSRGKSGNHLDRQLVHSRRDRCGEDHRSERVVVEGWGVRRGGQEQRHGGLVIADCNESVPQML